jgi:hypothetical protein
MRYFLPSFLILLGFVTTSCDSSHVEDEPIDIALSLLQGKTELFLSPEGDYVFRDSTGWGETTKSWWDIDYECDERACRKVPA